MRHRRLRRKLGIKSAHRKALLRNLVKGLVLQKRIRTTWARAKEASSFADQMITIAKGEGLHARRLLIQRLGSPDTARVLQQDIAPKFKDRQGGYTRVLRLGPRPGDNSEMALLEFTAVIETPEKPKKQKKEKKAKEVKPEVAPEKAQKEDEAPEKKAKGDKKESEKKGGFLGTLRKFLKGDE